ncbi:S-layer homology domain-containing protein, partial [Candidatus Peregrinibacteria bacterium]|nr:S-layer homology domain-containing protein [Candidatus Peregrinibacteria bacterium]
YFSYLYKNNIIEGYEVGDSGLREYRPDQKINRAEFLTLILEHTGAQIDKGYSKCFPDVPVYSWYNDAVCYAKERGIVQGYVDGNFKPGNTITEVEVLKIMGEVEDWEISLKGVDDFWYTPYLDFALGKNLVDGPEYVTLEADRGDIAEIIFRDIVIDEVGVEIDAPYEVLDDGELDDGSETVVALGMDVEGIVFQDRAIDFDDGAVALVSFQAKPKADDRQVVVKSLNLHNLKATVSYGLKRIYMKNDVTGEIIFDSGYRIRLFDWVDGAYLIDFENDLVFEPGKYVKYTIYGDFDWEIYNGELQFGFFADDDFMTDYDFVYLNNVTGPVLSRNEAELSYGVYDDLCVLWDPEANRPYLIGQNAPEGAPLERGEVLDPPAGAHKIKPIDQKQRSICLSASVYSSLRWFEERFNLENLIVDGLAGLDDLVAKLNGPDKTNARAQLDALVKHVEKKYPGCIDIDYNTQSGFNVTCDELLEYNKKQCDVPFQFICQRVDAAGNPLPGDAGKKWGHGVDLVDVKIDPNDPNQCTLEFANSWSDPAHPGEDLDGLGGGRYEKGEYNDDTEVFDPELPWGDDLKCTLYAAVFMCIDPAKCP